MLVPICAKRAKARQTATGQASKTATRLASGGLRGWRALGTDDREGVIDAEYRRLLSRRVDRVTIRVSLDENGQTRVDMECRSPGTNGGQARRARLLARFARKLDRDIAARPQDILDPSRIPPWLGGHLRGSDSAESA